MITNGRTLIITTTDRDQTMGPTDFIKIEVYCAMKGWVYIAKMSDAEGVVKIGYSTKDPAIRIKEWSEATGAPGKANLVYAALVEHPRRVEAAAHRDLKIFNTKGEWFRVPEIRAMAAIKANATPLYEEGVLVTSTTDVEKDQATSAFKRHRKTEQKKRRVRREADKAKKKLLGILLAILFVILALIFMMTALENVVRTIGP